MRRLLGLLLALDLLMIVGLVRPIRLTSHYPGDPLGLYDVLTHTPGSTWRFLFLTCALVGTFVAAYVVSRALPAQKLELHVPGAGWMPGPLRRARIGLDSLTLTVFGGAALLVLACLFLYPASSNDLFHYVMEGRILWVHHANPLTVAPNQYPYDPFSYSVVWENLPSPYGPAWILLTGIPLLLGHGDQIWTFVAFKLLACAFYFLAGFAIFRIVRITRPGAEWSAALLWLWNPLVVMYVAGNGANDAIMMGLTLLSLYFGVRGRWRIAFPLLAIATLVKFVCAVLIPLLVVYAVLTTPRAKWRALAESLGVSAAIGLILYAPFWRGEATLTTIRFQASQFTDSPSALLLHMLQHVTSPHRAEVFTKVIALSLFAIAYLLIARFLLVRRARLSASEMVIAAFAVMCAYTMLSVFWFQPWYLIWLLSLGALNGGVRARLTLLFSFTGLLTHTGTSIAALYGWYFYDPTREVAVVVSMTFLPPALYIAAILYRRSALWPLTATLAARLTGRRSPPRHPVPATRF